MDDPEYNRIDSQFEEPNPSADSTGEHIMTDEETSAAMPDALQDDHHEELEDGIYPSIEGASPKTVRDPNSLFVPEYSPSPSVAARPSPPPAPRSGVSEPTPPPTSTSFPTLSSVPTPTAIPTPAVVPTSTPAPIHRQRPSVKPSLFAKFKKMQQTAQSKGAAYEKHAADLHSVPSASNSGSEEVPIEEMEHRRALAEFQRQKQHYDKVRLQHNGHLPFRQEVEWMRVKGTEDARLKKRLRDLIEAKEGEEDDLFPQVRAQPADIEDESDDDFLVAGSSRKRRRGDDPRRDFQPVSMQDAEMRAMRVALEADNDRPKKKTKAVASPSGDEDIQPKGKAAKSKTTRPPRPKAARTLKPRGPRNTAKSKREIERAKKQVGSLFDADVFQQQAGEGAADQPVFQSRRKGDLLKELCASIPLPEQGVARNDMSSLLQASRDFDGRASCKVAANGNWMIRGMKTSLKGYQMLGSAFMRRRENDIHEPKGGLMADQMGLGKTLMMLANIVNSRDSMIRTRDPGPKTTLLVASPSLLTQWSEEIRQHVEVSMKIMRYGAGARVDSTEAEAILGGHDIVLASYNEVMTSYPKNVPPVEMQTAKEKTAWWEQTYREKRGVLHRMLFKRVVLDEAQQIKNHQGRTSIACRALMAQHKWALSGTPILNNLEELYPYFKFLSVPQTANFKIFKENYCGSGRGENNERLLVRLSQFMIRRTHADRMFNAPILKLPQAIQITHWCEFNSVERSIYNIVHTRFATNINNLSKKGTLAKSYNNVLVMLLRLRQLTAHPLMLQFVMRDLLEREDIEKIRDVVNTQAADSNAEHGRMILVIRAQLEAHELQEKKKATAKARRRLAAEEAAKRNGTEYIEPDDDLTEDDDVPVDLQDGGIDGGIRHGRERNKSGKSFGKSYDFKPYINSLATGEDWEKKKERAKCAECDRHPTRPWRTSCGHLLCDPCYDIVMASAAEKGVPNGTCKACGTVFAACIPCEEHEEDATGPSRGTRNKAAQQKRKERERLDREDIADDWLELGGSEVLPSAKTLAIKSQILNWMSENPNVKIIIYTQFLAMIRILSKACQQEGWGSEQYQGRMSLIARDKAIKRFANDDSKRVLLASLRCGGLGLNLTMASKVVMIDPWWNQASEQQAFCRVFRIGQNDETFLSRMCVKNTVDERLIEMQMRKQEEIDAVMEDHGRTIKNLDIADLMRLFGNVEEDDRGNQFIVVDNPAPVGGFHADRDHEGYADEL
ncbi:hypothetical protein E8E13_000292 [Curvularia kusanoi]|uniref:Uncharacterized protein n=1 Tax=Curvularia kusanoi TaxID=90978 RepID=A0A9P4TGL0_CURKU|nr:hypothetical protein E8E13_000292 [Curvularia kusanoi]